MGEDNTTDGDRSTEDMIADLHAALDDLAGRLTEARRALGELKLGRACPEHKPMQHRDARPPWCPKCGLTAYWTEPSGLLDRRRRRD